MPRTQSKPAPVKTRSSSTPSEEWEEWMDWDQEATDKKHDGDGDSEGKTVESTPRTSVEETISRSSTSSKKRKFSFEENNTVSTPKFSATKADRPLQDRSHSVVEKRYRENLNKKIADLRECIPSLRKASAASKRGQATSQKQNKATVLTEAMAYIRQLEKRNSYLEDERRKSEEGLRPVDSEATECSQNSTPPTQNDADDNPNAAEEVQVSMGGSPPQGMIPVPDEMRRLWDEGRSDDHYADGVHQEPDVVHASSGPNRGGRNLGRIVFGGLAGVMIFDSYVTPQSHLEKRDDRGLSALPLHQLIPLSKRVLQIRRHILPRAYTTLTPVADVVVIFGICGLLLFLYLYYSKPPPRKIPAQSDPSLINAPAPSSPQDIRVNAWLTSIQTVWVPQRNMLLEMLALILETAAYLTRKVLGWHIYSSLTGRTSDQEIARVRAWEIALDAQLSGGDPEPSKTRLVLTLWASGTLPSTPARLMLKALHIRVLFWRPPSRRFGAVSRLMQRSARQLSRQQWIKAASLQESLADGEVQEDTGAKETDLLTGNLKSLLEEGCDAVLTDEVIQRAYDLAWNIPAENPGLEESGDGDEGEKDSPMMGPLDKLALWHNTAKGREGKEKRKELTKSPLAKDINVDVAAT